GNLLTVHGHLAGPDQAVAFPPRRSAASVTAEGIPEQRNEALLARIVAPALFRRGRQRVFRAPLLLVADLDPEARPVALAGHGAVGAARRAQGRCLHLAVAGKGRQERLQLQELGRGNRRRRRGEEQKDRVAHTRHPLHAPFRSARAACPVCDRKGRSRRRATSARRNIAVKIMRRYVGKTRSEEHTSELQSPYDLVCRLLLEKKKKRRTTSD